MEVRKLMGLVLLSCLLGCGSANNDSVSAASAGVSYNAQLRWTSYGIPHVKADDWGSIGFGYAYVTAVDAICVIAKDVLMVNGNLSEYFGAENGNLESDIFHKSVLLPSKLTDYDTVQSASSKRMNSGYVAGYNRFLTDHKYKLPASCANKPWVRPITEMDLARLAIGVGIRYGLGRFQKQIAQASPEFSRLAQVHWSLPEGIGSNAIAIGSELSSTGRGILLGNPHYPWRGASRFHMIHLTIPGEIDVMGASLLTSNRVAIGFNKNIAWTHTVSTAKRFTLYQLKLNPSNPLEYEYDGAYRTIEKRSVNVRVADAQGELANQTHETYFTHFGPVIESKALPWGSKTAYTMRDAVVDNYLTSATYDAISKAESTADIEAAISQQGVYWTNTIAADRQGNAYYADISGTPNIDQKLIDRCQIQLSEKMHALILLRGDDSNCEWYEDATTKVAGTLPADKMPRLTRLDYVSNSNDSYWLSNAQAPIEGYSPIIGSENSARSLRTRAGLTQLAELRSTKNRLDAGDLREMLYNHRNYAAELLLDDLLAFCEDDSRLKDACGVLSAWDRTMNVESKGGHVWREFWREARSIKDLYKSPFDQADPVNTPRGLNIENTEVREQLRVALLDAVERLKEANIALDARLGDIQYALRNGKKIPIPGGEGWAGMFSMIRSNLQPDAGYAPIFHGNSYIQTVSWDKKGDLQAKGMLTYSQSPEADSAHFSDLTELYALGQWIDLPFTELEIENDVEYRTMRIYQ